MASRTRNAREPIIAPKLLGQIPIPATSNLNKLFKSIRQERKAERGFAIPHTRNGWIDLFREKWEREKARRAAAGER